MLAGPAGALPQCLGDPDRRRRAFTGADISRSDIRSGTGPPARPSPAATATLTVDQLGTMMAEARSAFLEEKFDRAIDLYTRILGEPRNAYSEEAQELLGVARDRNGRRRWRSRSIAST